MEGGEHQKKSKGINRHKETERYQQARHIQRERESSTLQANLLRTSCSSPTFSFRVLVDGAELLLLPAKEKRTIERYQQARHIQRERELDSSSQLAAYKLLFAYLLF